MDDDDANSAKKRVCSICRFSDSNEYAYGEWKSSGDYTVHYFCVLFSSDTQQNGKDNEGIYGFLVEDLKKTCLAYSKTPCTYCKKKRATIKCCVPNCSSRFHLVCGIKRGCMNEFQDPFKSFCAKHVQIEEKEYKHSPDSICPICTEPLGEYNPLTSIPACCEFTEHGRQYMDYYHKACIQEYAVKFGSLTKCPSCGDNTENYQQFLRLRGIFVPVKDADYELSKDAFESLLYVHKRCDAEKCYCPKGRNYLKSKGDWKYYRCVYCGSIGVHQKCRVDDMADSFSCSACIEKYTQSQPTPHVLPNNNNDNDNDKNDDASEVNNSDQNPLKRKHKFDAKGAGKVWKEVHVNEKYKNTTYELMNPSDQNDAAVDARKRERKLCEDRLKMFFNNADFNSKPKPPPWLI